MEPLQKWPVQKKRRITWCRGRRYGGICDHRGRNLDVPQTKDEESGSNQAGTQDYHPYPRMSAEESSHSTRSHELHLVSIFGAFS